MNDIGESTKYAKIFMFADDIHLLIVNCEHTEDLTKQLNILPNVYKIVRYRVENDIYFTYNYNVWD